MDKTDSVWNKKYSVLFMTGLLLFGFSIGLSKTATNILAGLLLLGMLGLAAVSQTFRDAFKKNYRQPLLLPILLYIAVGVIGLFFSDHVADGVGIVNKMLGLLLVYFVCSVLLDSLFPGKDASFKAERLLVAFMAGVFVLDVIGLLTYAGFIGHKKSLLPVTALNLHHIWFSNLNAVAFYSAAAFFLFSGYRKSVQAKACLAVFMLLAIGCILLSLSRTAWFGVLLTGVVMSYLLLINKKVFLLAAISIGAVSVLLFYASPIVNERVTQIVSDTSQFAAGGTYSSLGGRYLMWQAAIKMFISNPVIGVGTGDYVATMTSYIKAGLMPDFLLEFNQPHNMYLFALATNGILGLCALVSIFYFSLRFSLPVLNKIDGEGKVLAFVAVAVVVHFIIAGMTDSFLNIQVLRYAFAFIAGVCIRNSVKPAAV